MEEFVKLLIEKVWLKPVSVLILLCMAVLGSMPTWPTVSDKSARKLIVYIVVISIIILVYIGCMIKDSILPKSKRNKLGILFLIDAVNKKQYEEIERMLIARFREILVSGLQDTFDIIYLPKEKVKKYDLQNKDSAKKLLIKTNCLFESSIRVLSDDSDNASKYQLSIENGILHATYIDMIQKKFQKEFTSATKFTRRISYQKENKIETLEVTAEQLAFACQYVLGLTCFYNSQYGLCETIFESLIKDIINSKSSLGIIGYLKNTLPQCCYDIHMIKAIISYQSYRIRRNAIDLAIYKEALTEANAFIPGTYDYHLNMAIYYMLARRDVKKSKEQIKICSTFKSESSWRYSDAFLCAYEGKGELTIYRKYKQAFRKDYDLAYLAWFIEEIHEQEPDKFKLLFALGMVYSELGQNSLAEESFNLFIEKYSGSYENKQKIELLILERLSK
ncbi:MAG: hypothetical protein EWM50_07505, partial [Gottschalkiaceae bacterium]